MKVGMKKIWWSIPMLLALAAIAYYGYLQQDKTSTNIMFFRIGTEDTAETISAWYNDEGTYYVFLPSYADIHTVTAAVNPAYMVEVDGTALTSETDLSAFTMGESYDVRITHGWRTDEEQICFLQSANVATMYIDTQSGRTSKIYADKNYKEQSIVRLFTVDGSVNYKSGGEADYLRGRGNSTWVKEKKPFNLYLGESANILGMGTAEKWVLLANAYDKTNLRNKLIQDLAKSIGQYDGFACDCQYVDLFINSEYRGLYLLAEKVEVADNRLKIGQNDLLFALHQPGKVNNPKAAIEWNKAICVEIHWPKNFDANQMNRLRERLMSFQTALNGSDSQQEDSLSRYIDYDSWTKKFLIDRVFSNGDAMIDSAYFWLNSADSKIYAGPCWDYDLTAGISYFPGRVSPNSPLGGRWGDEYTWYASLWKNKVFRDKAFTMYQSIFVPKLDELLSETIGGTSRKIERATELNSIRWGKMFRDSKTYSDNAATFAKHIQERMTFLESLWLNSVDYNMVILKLPDSRSHSIYAVSGSICDDIPTPEELGIEGASIWYREDTNEPFDYNSVITEDLTLYIKEEETTATETSRIEETTATDASPLAYISLHKAMLFRLAIVGLSGVALLALVWVDYKRNQVTR